MPSFSRIYSPTVWGPSCREKANSCSMVASAVIRAWASEEDSPLGSSWACRVETRCQQQKFLRLSLCQDPVKQFGALFAVLDPGKTLPFYIGKDLFDVLW